MLERIVNSEIVLIPYYPNPETALAWYQDPEICKQVDNIDEVYSPERLERMYAFLDSHGSCYYIQYRGALIGDVSLQNSAEISIVISKEYQNQHIGRQCILSMLELAREKGFPEVYASIYPFNTQSQHVFLSLGFQKKDVERYIYKLDGPKGTAQFVEDTDTRRAHG